MKCAASAGSTLAAIPPPASFASSSQPLLRLRELTSATPGAFEKEGYWPITG